VFRLRLTRGLRNAGRLRRALFHALLRLWLLPLLSSQILLSFLLLPLVVPSVCPPSAASRSVVPLGTRSLTLSQSRRSATLRRSLAQIFRHRNQPRSSTSEDLHTRRESTAAAPSTMLRTAPRPPAPHLGARRTPSRRGGRHTTSNASSRRGENSTALAPPFPRCTGDRSRLASNGISAAAAAATSSALLHPPEGRRRVDCMSRNECLVRRHIFVPPGAATCRRDLRLSLSVQRRAACSMRSRVTSRRTKAQLPSIISG
jgi:hypothetical protein